MSPFTYIKSIFALDTIDTRFTTSSSTPYQALSQDRSAAISKRDDSVGGPGIKTDYSGKPIAQPAQWKTLEFYFYYVVFIVAVPYMFWVAYDVSRPSDPRYHKFESLLSDGWVPGRKIDISDAQYHTFRGNIPYLSALLIVHPLLRKLYNSLRPIPPSRSSSPSNKTPYISAASGDARLSQRVTFDCLFAFILLSFLHGFSIFKILAILYINYNIATQLPRKYIPVVTWVFNICTLFANELSEGYKMGKIANYISPLQEAGSMVDGNFIHEWANWIDSYSGLMSRWEISFNITVLRLISFNLDYYWSLDRRGSSPIEKQLDPTNLPERERISTPASQKDYSFPNYLAYTIYAPLYIAGPILTFNDYISQSRYPSHTISVSRTIKYGLRFLFCLLAMELLLHFDYCVAISKGNPDWSTYTPAQLTLLSYFNLHVLWLKLLLPWRAFRLWSLMDGIDPPENMLRCLSNNPSTVAFWRAWHRSYNRWIIRYIYIPLGGNDTRTWLSTSKSILNYVLVFTWVALWHDISLNLLIWGWMIVFFMLPEVTAKMIFPRRKWEGSLGWYRVLSGVGSVGNCCMMMTANLVGFAVGLDGLKSIVEGIFHDYHGLLFLVTASSAVFVGCQIMFEVRENEMRRGIFLKC